MDTYIFDDRAFVGGNAAYRGVSDTIRDQAEADLDHGPVHFQTDGSGLLLGLMRGVASALTRRGGTSVLRIIAHGSPGHILLTSNGLSNANVAQMARLAGLVGRVELHCCNVVSSAPQTVTRVSGINTWSEIPNASSGSLLPPVSGGSDADLASAALRGISVDEAIGRSLRAVPGVQLLIRMSDMMRCRVKGAMRLQTLSVSDWNFEGPTLTANGRLLTLNVPARDTMFPGLPQGSYFIP